jgi:hypothetical protein
MSVIRRSKVRKSQPTSGDVHISVPLTNISIAYMQDQNRFIADKVFPIVSVAQQFNQYYKFDKNEWYADEAQVRAPGTESAGSGFTLTTDNYACVTRAFHKDIDDPTRANADSVLSLDAAATRFVTNKMLISRERAFLSRYFTTGTWTNEVNGVASGEVAGVSYRKWSDYAGSDPLNDVELGKRTILGTTGYEITDMTVSYKVMSVLRNHPKIRDQFKYTSAESINEDMMARFFNVQKFNVSRGVFSTGNEGNAARATQFMAGDHVLLSYAPDSPSLMEPSAGYIFSWSGLVGSEGSGIRTKKFRMEELESDRVEGQMSFDMKRVAADLGYFLNGAV